MRFRFILFALVLGLLVIVAGAALRVHHPRASLGARIDSLTLDYITENRLPGISVAVVRGRDTIRLRGYGYADRASHRHAGPTTVYEIASMTKQITAAAVLRLVEQHKIGLDDDIARYVSSFPLRGRHVTVRQLLNHTAGIPEVFQRPWLAHATEELPADSVLALGKETPFLFEPGTAWSYSNTGYMLLGRIVERVSGEAYAAYLAREFFEPLGMTQTRYCPTFADRDTSFARGYDWLPGDATIAAAPLWNVRQAFASGAVCSTARDMLRWQKALHTGGVLSAGAYREMTTPDTLADGHRLAYGFGLVVEQLGPHRMISHGGAFAGFVSYGLWIADDSLNVVFLGNNMRPDDVLALNIARAVLGMPLLDRVHLPPTVAPDARLRARVAGSYEFVDSNGKTIPLTVYSTGDALMFSFDGTNRRLLYLGNNTFGARFLPSLRLAFGTANDGSADATHPTLEIVGRPLPGRRVP